MNYLSLSVVIDVCLNASHYNRKGSITPLHINVQFYQSGIGWLFCMILQLRT